MKKQLCNLFKSVNLDINVCFNSFKVGNYFSNKDVTPASLKASVVYLFKCSVDPRQTYIGQTKRHLFKRIEEHCKHNSAIFSHRLNCSCCCNNNNFSVINSANNVFDLQIKEALHIKLCNPSLNSSIVSSGQSFLLNVF